ncbi:tyrosine-type recombinase/integrase [Clostridium taeniosporum]|uniref:Integrase n=1 Tax=Clostridium taeniosporum TaxID=394958 RepID=A0A1D7XJI7_9CLOT|nr:tyrosine-type recombinase/integrase [Clostridium taeniosporum]AOR23492.1 integrase [Clostridium taeniosporum]
MASIKGQVFHVIDSNFSPGQDKRNDKFDENMEKTKIYSFSERNNLRQTAMELAQYCKVIYDVKQVKDITYGMVRNFMKDKANTCNQNTLDNISSRLSKIGKLVNQTYKSCDVDWSFIKVKSMVGEEKLRDIPMSREDFNKLISYAKENNLTSRAILGVELAGAFGLRVSEVCKLQVRDIDFEGMKLHIHQSKGGLSRDLNIKEEYKKFLQKVMTNKASLDRLVPIKEDSVNKWIRETLPKVEGIDATKYLNAKTGVHSIRKMWATERYIELILQGLDEKDACNKVSNELGHGDNRWDVVKNYIYK